MTTRKKAKVVKMKGNAKNIQDLTSEITTTKRTAKEDMDCHACQWLATRLDAKFFDKLTPEEQKAVIKARNNKGKILKGSQYIEENGKYQGRPYKSTYIKAIHEINNKYGVYIN